MSYLLLHQGWRDDTPASHNNCPDYEEGNSRSQTSNAQPSSPYAEDTLKVKALLPLGFMDATHVSLCFCLTSEATAMPPSSASQAYSRPAIHDYGHDRFSCVSQLPSASRLNQVGVAFCTTHHPPPPPRHRKGLASLPNHVRAASAPDPNLMHPPSLDIDPRAWTVGDLVAVRLVRIPQCHLAVDNQMRCQPGMRVGSVV
ncbi:hypothetical protein HDV57DRAFT_123566 [Trichoderma longibrachiatum]